MAAFASAHAHAPRLGLHLLVAVGRTRLDRHLAAGASPRLSPALTLRAAQLAAPRTRTRVARSLRRAVATGWQRRGSGVPVSRAAVVEAQPALLALADDLTELHDPAPRGVALALALLTDGTGPLYRPWRPGELADAADAARHAL